MPRKAAPGTGGDFLGKSGWLELADANAVVLIQRTERMDDFEGDRGDTEQIRADVYVVSTTGGKRDGEFWPSQNIISKAIVSKIGDDAGVEDGEVIAARVVRLGKGDGAYPGANEPSDPEYDAITEFYESKSLDPDDTDDDARLFAALRKAHAAEQRDEVAEKREKVERTAKGRTGSGRSTSRTRSKAAGAENADAADDEPPF